MDEGEQEPECRDPMAIYWHTEMTTFRADALYRGAHTHLRWRAADCWWEMHYYLPLPIVIIVLHRSTQGPHQNTHLSYATFFILFIIPITQ